MTAVSSPAPLRLLGLAVARPSRGADLAVIAACARGATYLQSSRADVRGDIAVFVVAPGAPEHASVLRALSPATPRDAEPYCSLPLVVIAPRARVARMLASHACSDPACTLAAALDAWTPCADVPAFAVEAWGRHWGFVLTPPPGGDDAADRGVNVRARGAA